MRGGVWPSREGFFFSKTGHVKEEDRKIPSLPPTKLYTHYTACLRTSVSISFYHTRAQFEKPGIPESMKFLKSRISTCRPNPTKIKSKVKLCLVIYISHNQIKRAAWLYVARTIYFLKEFPFGVMLENFLLSSDLITNALSAFTQRLDLPFKDC